LSQKRAPKRSTSNSTEAKSGIVRKIVQNPQMLQSSSVRKELHKSTQSIP